MGLYVSPFSVTSTQEAYDIVTTAQSDSIMISPSVDISSAYVSGSSTAQLYGVLPAPSEYMPTAFEFIRYLNTSQNISTSTMSSSYSSGVVKSLSIGIIDDNTSTYCSLDTANTLASTYELILSGYVYVNNSNTQKRRAPGKALAAYKQST